MQEMRTEAAGPRRGSVRRLSVDRMRGVLFRARVPDQGAPALTFVGPQAEELLGQKLDPSVPDWGLAQRLHPDDRDAFYRAAGEAIALRAMLRHEARFVMPDGTLKWIQCVASPTAEPGGVAYDGFLLDVTDARQVEAEIQRLSAVVDQMGDALLVTDRRGVIQYVNPAFEEHLGYTKEEIIGKKASVLKSGFHDDAYYAKLWATVLAGEVFRGEMINRHKDGRLVHEQKTISPLRDDAGRIVLLISTARDITAHRAAEMEVRHSEERYRSFVANSSEGIWRMECSEPVPTILAEDEQVARVLRHAYLAECNDAYARLHGFARAADLVGTAISKLIASPESDGVEPLRRFVAAGYQVHDHDQDVEVGGERRSVRTSFTGVVDGERLVRIWGVTRDVTTEKRAQESLRALNEQLERRVADRTEALARANDALGRLATEDPLTGLANRRRFDETLDIEIRRAIRRNEALSLIMCDVDFFKSYNDHYGHPEGDRCLMRVAETIRDTFRRVEDLPARYGGEEFAVILPGMPAGGARVLAEWLQTRLAYIAIPHEHSSVSRNVTLSIGIVSAIPRSDRDGGWFIEQADLALYRSKNAGRSMITLSEPDLADPDAHRHA